MEGRHCSKQGVQLVIVSLTISLFCLAAVDGACTLPSGLSGEWIDSVKGGLMFNETTGQITGYQFAQFGQLTLTCWMLNDTVYIFESSEFEFFSLNFTAYFCWNITQINSDLFYFYEYGNELPGANNERVQVYLPAFSRVYDTMCANPDIGLGTYRIWYRNNTIIDSISDCPLELQAHWNYTVANASSYDTCSNDVNSLDLCGNATTLDYNSTECGTYLGHATNGSVYCLFHVYDISRDIFYLTLYQDGVADGSTTYEFTCLIVSFGDDSYLMGTQHPNQCPSSMNDSYVASPGSYVSFIKTSGCSSEFPWWIIVVSVLGFLFLVGLISMLIWFFCCYESEEEKKKRKMEDEDERFDPDLMARGDRPPSVSITIMDGRSSAGDGEFLIGKEDELADEDGVDGKEDKEPSEAQKKKEEAQKKRLEKRKRVFTIDKDGNVKKVWKDERESPDSGLEEDQVDGDAKAPKGSPIQEEEEDDAAEFAKKHGRKELKSAQEIKEKGDRRSSQRKTRDKMQGLLSSKRSARLRESARSGPSKWKEGSERSWGSSGTFEEVQFEDEDFGLSEAEMGAATAGAATAGVATAATATVVVSEVADKKKGKGGKAKTSKEKAGEKEQESSKEDDTEGVEAAGLASVAAGVVAAKVAETPKAGNAAQKPQVVQKKASTLKKARPEKKVQDKGEAISSKADTSAEAHKTDGEGDAAGETAAEVAAATVPVAAAIPAVVAAARVDHKQKESKEEMRRKMVAKKQQEKEEKLREKERLRLEREERLKKQKEEREARLRKEKEEKKKAQMKKRYAAAEEPPKISVEEADADPIKATAYQQAEVLEGPMEGEKIAKDADSGKGSVEPPIVPVPVPATLPLPGGEPMRREQSILLDMDRTQSQLADAPPGHDTPTGQDDRNLEAVAEAMESARTEAERQAVDVDIPTDVDATAERGETTEAPPPKSVDGGKKPGHVRQISVSEVNDTTTTSLPVAAILAPAVVKTKPDDDSEGDSSGEESEEEPSPIKKRIRPAGFLFTDEIATASTFKAAGEVINAKPVKTKKRRRLPRKQSVDFLPDRTNLAFGLKPAQKPAKPGTAAGKSGKVVPTVEGKGKEPPKSSVTLLSVKELPALRGAPITIKDLSKKPPVAAQQGDKGSNQDLTVGDKFNEKSHSPSARRTRAESNSPARRTPLSSRRQSETADHAHNQLKLMTRLMSQSEMASEADPSPRASRRSESIGSRRSKMDQVSRHSDPMPPMPGGLRLEGLDEMDGFSIPPTNGSSTPDALQTGRVGDIIVARPPTQHNYHKPSRDASPKRSAALSRSHSDSRRGPPTSQRTQDSDETRFVKFKEGVLKQLGEIDQQELNRILNPGIKRYPETEGPSRGKAAYKSMTALQRIHRKNHRQVAPEPSSLELPPIMNAYRGHDAPDNNDPRMRRWLEELYHDKKFLDKSLAKGGDDEYVSSRTMEGREYLLNRAKFWSQQQPLIRPGTQLGSRAPLYTTSEPGSAGNGNASRSRSDERPRDMLPR